jgi:hypothetical protein
MPGTEFWMILLIIVGAMSARDGGVPMSKDAPPSPAQPPSTNLATPAPDNIIVPPIPECSATRKARGVQVATERLAGKRVVLRGVLTFGFMWTCRCEDCKTDWIIVDRTTQKVDASTPHIVVSLPGRRLRSRSGSHSEPWTVVARGRYPEPPDIDVFATGVLRGGSGGSAFVLEDAQLCRAKVPSKRERQPLLRAPAQLFKRAIKCAKGLDGLRI